jgi:hypothetical protein
MLSDLAGLKFVRPNTVTQVGTVVEDDVSTWNAQ